MEGTPHGLDALITFSTEHREKWSDHIGRKQVPDLANIEWNHINQSHGWAARIQHAIQQVVPTVNDIRAQWNLVAAYDLYTGTLLKVPDLVFMPREPEKDKPEIWVKRLDQYRVAYMKLAGPGAQSGTQAGNTETVDPSSGTPEKHTLGAGGNNGAGATPPEDMSGKTAAPMDEDGATARLELLSLKEEPLGLKRDNLRRVRKRKGAPKWVRKLTKMVDSMTKKSTEEVPLGIVAQEIWGIVMELDRDGRRLLKDEAKNKKQREKEKKKKAKAKAKKRTKKEQKRRKHEDRKKSKMAVSDSSDESSSSSDSSDSPTSDSSSDSSSDYSGSSFDGEKRTRPRDSGGRNGTMKSRRGRPKDFEFWWINGRQLFHTNKGTWHDCTNPPSRPCKFCGNR